MTEKSLEKLKRMVAEYPAAQFRPAEVFVARCGVLTIVFDGFGRSILDLKREIEFTFPGLEPEHDGSKWPKVSLAILQDGVRLDRADIARIRDIADSFSKELRSHDDAINVGALSAVEYGCRSLEERIRSVDLPFSDDEDRQGPSEDHAAFVRSILAQFSRHKLNQYAGEVNMHEHRENHYRSPARGWSLVADVPADQLWLAERLTNEVLQAVPDRYRRLDPASLHITIRTLDPLPE